jgi:hypothetical protein
VIMWLRVCECLVCAGQPKTCLCSCLHVCGLSYKLSWHVFQMPAGCLPACTHLPLLKAPTCAQHCLVQVADCGLHTCTCSSARTSTTHLSTQNRHLASAVLPHSAAEQFKHTTPQHQQGQTDAPVLVLLALPHTPVALATRCRSSSGTRPAQKMPLSAKYCVPRSPMASLQVEMQQHTTQHSTVRARHQGNSQEYG